MPVNKYYLFGTGIPKHVLLCDISLITRFISIIYLICNYISYVDSTLFCENTIFWLITL